MQHLREIKYDYKSPATRKSRAKQNLVWEGVELESHGLYAENLSHIATRFPHLSKTELRVAALVKAMLSSREIAERLNVREETVENHRSKIRQKLRLEKSESLQSYLLTII
jgi:DNA-binding CsgD family transcriptional regulator